MTITSIKGTNIELTDAIKAYVTDKLEVIEKLTQDFEPAVELDAEVGKTTTHHNKGPFFFAELNMRVPGEVLRAVKETEDLYEAIDLVKDDLRRQVKEYKDRLSDAHRGPRPDKV
ncbi:MAG TPA: ribosome-associated translation inhibitor RaiA [Patescibacteria group bacterium]|nr:ribosome-associated translation inhibitor RaiA [Patescibacteria group bacterium]